MTYITPPDFIEFDLSKLVCVGLLTVLHKGKCVVSIEAAGEVYWLRGRSGGVRTIIDRVGAETRLEVKNG